MQGLAAELACPLVAIGGSAAPEKPGISGNGLEDGYSLRKGEDSLGGEQWVLERRSCRRWRILARTRGVSTFSMSTPALRVTPEAPLPSGGPHLVSPQNCPGSFLHLCGKLTEWDVWQLVYEVVLLSGQEHRL